MSETREHRDNPGPHADSGFLQRRQLRVPASLSLSLALVIPRQEIFSTECVSVDEKSLRSAAGDRSEFWTYFSESVLANPIILSAVDPRGLDVDPSDRENVIQICRNCR